ncbi:hypothetical protein BX616_004881 [Lobosporangium transversale]|nr:hypothetical protein BX616_004881 [Lobosporangium transversale]
MSIVADSATVNSRRTTRHSTQNATNLRKKNGKLIKVDMSEDSDFESETPAVSSSSSKQLAIKVPCLQKKADSSAVKSKKRAVEETVPSSLLTRKRRQRNNVKQEQNEVESPDTDMVSATSSAAEEEEKNSAGIILPTLESDNESEFYMDEDRSSEDEDEWEEVSISGPIMAQGQEDDEEQVEELSGPWQYSAVEIVFDKPLGEIKRKSKSKGITKEERMIRILIHQTHLMCLIANGLLRNRWISHPKFSAVALSLVPDHIARSVRATYDSPAREINALQVLALWWRDSFIVSGPGIQSREYLDLDVVGVEAVISNSSEECLKKRKNLQRRLLNRNGSTDVCSQLFTGICRALGLNTRLIESLQACPFKVSLAKGNSEPPADNETGASSMPSTSEKGKKKRKERELDEDDTTRGSRVVLVTPHRLPKKPTKLTPNHKMAEPPVFWTEVYSTLSRKWITIDPVRGFVNSPLKMHPSKSCSSNVLAYVVAYDEDNYVTDVTRRYTSMWNTATKKLRVQPSGNEGYDWWKHTLSGLVNPHRTKEEDLEEEELLKAEVSERMPTKLGDFNNHPLYALERHLKKYEVLYPRVPVLGHIRGEAIYPRSCVKQVKSKENWLRRGRVIKPEEIKPVKWVKSHAATIYQLRLRQQRAISGGGSNLEQGMPSYRKCQVSGNDKEDDDEEMLEYKIKNSPLENGGGGFKEDSEADLIPLFGEWQTEAYQPPWVVDGKVPRNEYGRQDVFTPDMVPLGGSHLKGRNIAHIARLLGVDYVEAVTGFEFHSRRSMPVIQGIIVPTEQAELVMDAYHELLHQQDQEAHKKKRMEALKNWRKLIKGMLTRSRLMEEYGGEHSKDDREPSVSSSEDKHNNGEGDDKAPQPQSQDQGSDQQVQTTNTEPVDSGAGFMID